MNIEKVLNAYLEYQIHLKPTSSEDSIFWACYDCSECGNKEWRLSINGTYTGIKITDSKLLNYIIDKKVYLNENDDVKYYKP